MSNLDISRAERLDQYVVRQIPAMSRAYAAKLIERGDVKVNGSKQKPGYKLKEEDSVVIDVQPEAELQIPDIELEVIYEDKDCIVINKPAGILTHSKGAFNPEATVATWLRTRVKNLEGERAGIVHRLDRATSGVMICARNPAALSWLQKQFAQRKTKKIYCALIFGHLTQKEAVIDMPIERNPKHPQTFRVGSNGKPAQTHYKLLAEGLRYTLISLAPTTGRTHQLRVHMSQLGHPIAGDTLYHGEQADRLYLHAESLELTLPNKERRTFTVPLPDEFIAKLQP